jgi:hypothetical protein
MTAHDDALAPGHPAQLDRSDDLLLGDCLAGTIGAQAERQRLEICKRLRRGG